MSLIILFKSYITKNSSHSEENVNILNQYLCSAKQGRTCTSLIQDVPPILPTSAECFIFLKQSIIFLNLFSFLPKYLDQLNFVFHYVWLIMTQSNNKVFIITKGMQKKYFILRRTIKRILILSFSNWLQFD